MPIVVERVRAAVRTDGGVGAGEVSLVHDLSCTLREDAVTVVVGRSGSGKSTFLDMLTGLRELQGGSVRYGHVPLWQGRRLNPDVNRAIGAVFQQPEQQLFAASVQREFRYSLRPLGLTKEEADKRIRAALETVRLPEELLERSPFTLSAGQQRRVALATVFAAQPEWLFLDEPTSGLDPEGVAALVAWLRRWKQQSGCGIVIATHDLDALLPLADRVIVLDDGAIAADLTPQQLYAHPHILQAAGVGYPGFLELSLLLREAGLPVAADSSADAMAASICRLLDGKISSLAAAGCGGAGQGTTAAEQGAAAAAAAAASAAIDAAAASEPHPAASVGQSPAVPAWNWAAELDPRAKWVFLGLVSAAVLLQHRWSGIACSAALSLAVVACCRYPLRRFWPVLRAYIWFIALSVGLSGLQLGGGGTAFGLRFSVPHALETVQPLLRLVPVMLLGLLFGWTTSYFQVKRGLEQSLSFLKRWRSGVEALTFTASMMFRLIPLLAQLFERFSRIVRTRGKSRAKPGALALRDVHAVMVPFLLSCFQLAEHLSLAAESKGYRVGAPRTSSMRLQLGWGDALTMAAGAGIFAILWLLRG